MDVPTAALLVAGGAVAGFFAGAFAIGDGLVMVPVLLLALQGWHVSSLVATQVAMGTSLAATAAASVALAWRAKGRDQVLRRETAVLALAGAAAAVTGAAIAAALEGTALRRIFGFVLLVAAVRLMGGRRKSGKSTDEPAPVLKLIPVGFITGLVSSLTGSGAGVVSVPLLYSYLRIPLRKSTGTAHAVAVVCALAGAVAYIAWGWSSEFLPDGMHGFIDWPSAVALALGAVAGALAGERMGERADKPAVRYTYAVALLFVMIRMSFV